MTMTLLLGAVVVLAVALAVAIVALVRGGGRHDDATILGDQIEDAAHAQARAVERLERELRGEIVENARGSRTELAGSFAQLQQTLAAQLTSVATVQNNQIEGFAQQLGKLVAGNAGYGETFLMDNQGALVCATTKTTDYWQGDEAKWQRAFNEGKGEVFIDRPKFDHSSSQRLAQISIPVLDNGAAIGAVTVGISIDKLQK